MMNNNEDIQRLRYLMLPLILVLVIAVTIISAAPSETAAEKSVSVKVEDLPVIKEMPNPLVMNSGEKVTTLEQWKIRRQEMIDILEEYEYGHMPPAPGNVKATVVTPTKRITASRGFGFGRRGRGTQNTTDDSAPLPQADFRMFHLTFGPKESLGFDLAIFTPVASDTSPKKYPVLITLGYSANEQSISSAMPAFNRGYAIAVIPYQQLGADSPNYRSTGFFSAYPEYDWNDFSAWAWGISRAIDYLVTDPAIDKDKIMVTGASRLGQAALLVGAFDERIALTAPVAGGMAFRFSGKEMGNGLGQGITEIVDQNTYWFGPRFVEFRNQTERLPCDQHWLLALTAPRLFIMSNSLDDEYGRAYAAVQTYLGAKPVYEFLKAEDNLGINFRPGGHGMTPDEWEVILDFADQKLLKKPGERKFDVLPPSDQLK